MTLSKKSTIPKIPKKYLVRNIPITPREAFPEIKTNACKRNLTTRKERGSHFIGQVGSGYGGR